MDVFFVIVQIAMPPELDRFFFKAFICELKEGFAN